MPSNSIVLLANAGISTGSSSTWHGGAGIVTIEGTISGATVKLQCQTPNGAWVDVASYTALGVAQFDLPYGIPIRATVTGGTPANLFMYAIPQSERRG